MACAKKSRAIDDFKKKIAEYKKCISNTENDIKTNLLNKYLKYLKSEKNADFSIKSFSQKNNRNYLHQRSAEKNIIIHGWISMLRDKVMFFLKITLLRKDEVINSNNNIDCIIEHKIICDDDIITNKFNDYFINVGSSLAI